MKPHIPLLFLLAVLILTGAAAAEENDHIHPPEYGVILTGDTVIDTIAPDKKTAEAFIWSSIYDTAINCLMEKETPGNLPEETLRITLTDFPLHARDGEIIVRTITVAELISSMNTTFTGHGWGSSHQTHEYIEISVGDPAWRSDLINAWNFIQVMAQQNGFEKTIPIQFANIKLTSSQNYSTCIVWNNGTITCNYDPTPTPAATSLPLAGILGGLGLAAVLVQERRRL